MNGYDQFQFRERLPVDGLGAGPANTVVMFPVELTETVKALTDMLGKRAEPAGK